MIDYIRNFINSTLKIVTIPNIGVNDIIEIIIMAFMLYYIAKRLINTRLWVVAKGMVMLLIVYGVLNILQMNVLASIFKWIIILCMIGIVMACQPEVKKLLEQAGSKNYIRNLISSFDKQDKENLEFSDEELDAIVEACDKMSKVKTGALIVFELDTPLDDIISTGIDVDAKITKQMLIQVFEKNTPLHDGALVIRNGRIASATCYLPLSNNINIDKDLGTRHRAGIGVTEQTDCYVLIVSEETGAISYVRDGNIRHNVSIKKLRQSLHDLQHRNERKKTQVSDIAKKFSNNIQTKIISVFGAFALWIVILAMLDPVGSKRISGINIELLNGDKITSLEQTYEVTSSTDMSIIIKGRESVIDNITANDIKAVADFENINQLYSIPISLEIEGYDTSDVEITYKSQDSVSIKMDNISETVMDVTCELNSSSPDGTYVNSITSDYNTITIKGSNSIVSTIDKVVLYVDAAEEYESFNQLVEPVIYDRNGSVIDNNKLELSNTEFNVNVEMLNTKKVALNVNLVNNDESNTKISSYTVEKDAIVVGYRDESFKDTDEVTIDIDVTNDIKDITALSLIKTIDLNNYLPDGLVVASTNSKVNINVELENATEKDYIITKDMIEVRNLGRKLSCEIKNNEINFKLHGYKNDLDNIDLSNLKFYIDVKGLTVGETAVELHIDNISELNNISIENLPSIDIEIKK